MKIRNNTEKLHNIGVIVGKERLTVKLAPGLNEVNKDTYAVMSKLPYFKGLVKSGDMSIDKSKDSDAPKAKVSTSPNVQNTKNVENDGDDEFVLDDDSEKYDKPKK